MKKKLFTLLICAFAWIGVNATVTVTNGDNGYTVVTTTTAGELGSNDISRQLNGVKKLKLVGPYNGDPDFLKLRDWCKPEDLDLSEATIAQGTVSYTYYYLDTSNEQKNVRYIQGNSEKPLLKDETGWYYMDGSTRKNVAEADVRVYSASVSGGQVLPDGWKNTLKSISLPTSSDFKVIPAKFCNGFKFLESVTIPNNVEVIGNEAFYETAALTTVDLPNNLKAICYQAFYKSGLETISIPASVEVVEYMAYTECTNATKLIFEASTDPSVDDSEHHMIVKNYAFFNLSGIKDIYINTAALVDCENGAFDYNITWGHGDATASTFCTLHFKASSAKHYANLSHPLTTEIAMDAAKFHNWLMQHYQFASKPSANGWYEFIHNGTIEEKKDEIKGTQFLCTYSDYDYDRIVPPGVKAYIVTGLKQDETTGDYSLNLVQLLVIPKRTGVILYGVPNSKNEDNEDVLSMSLCEIANGLPLRRDYWYTLDEAHKATLTNYLWPSCVTLDPNGYEEENYVYYELDENGDVKKDDLGDYIIEVKKRMVLKEATKASSVKPYDGQDKFETPTGVMNGYDATVLNGFFRNFYMSRYGTTNSGKKYKSDNNDVMESNFVGFFRAKKSNINPGKAYLRLSADEYSDKNGGEVIINGDTEQFKDVNDNNKPYDMLNYQVEYSASDGKPVLPNNSGYWILGANPDMQWDLDSNWGDRTKITNKTSGAKFVAVTFFGEPDIFENGDGTATMIVPSSMIEDVDKGVYYNLQGVKVTNPSKGVYIKNGKKVVLN